MGDFSIPPADILIIDDDPLICRTLCSLVQSMGLRADTARTAQEGLRRARAHKYDVVLLDVGLPDADGLDVLPVIRATESQPEIIIITGLGDPDGAELAIKSGAWDYVEKPSSIKAMMLPVVRALQYRREKAGRKIKLSFKREGIVGSSAQLLVCLDQVAQAAACEASVLVTGETGTGKELFAWAIHQNSARASKNFVVVDCAALPETLVESSLFGYEKGAYTGADKTRDGLIMQADGGTLFLDEVGELPLSIQKAFLRVLQEHRFRRVGGKEELQSDFRVVAATNRNLSEMVEKGEFRKDLLFRLQSIQIELPPLRERREDIKELLLHYLGKLCDTYGMEMKGFSPEFLELTAAYHWPGNVREFVSALERALAAAQEDPILFQKHLPVHIRVAVTRDRIGKEPDKPRSRLCLQAEDAESYPNLKDLRDAAVAEAEREYLIRLLKSSGGDVKEACRISDISRPRLYALLKKYGLSTTGDPRGGG